MLHIEKSSEPSKLCEHRQNKATEPTYGNLPPATKEVIRQSLLDDQGYLCAYCTQRISAELDDRGKPKMRIEHYHDQSTHPERQLDWRNMLGVCQGGERRPYDNHCDVSRGARPLTIDPLDHPERHIHYQTDGRICAADETIDRELDKILNLNGDPLKRYRKAAWDGFYQALKSRGDRAFTVAALKRELSRLESKDKKGRYREYRGYVMYFLRKKLNAQGGGGEPATATGPRQR